MYEKVSGIKRKVQPKLYGWYSCLWKNDFSESINSLKIILLRSSKMPKKQQSIEELEKEEEDFVFRKKEELAHFLKLSYMDGLKMDQLVYTYFPIPVYEFVKYWP
jgi:hypothetical protein